MLKSKKRFSGRFGNKVYSQSDFRGLPGAVPEKDSKYYNEFCAEHTRINDNLAKARQDYFVKHGTYLMGGTSLFTASELAAMTRSEFAQKKMLSDMGMSETENGDPA